MESISLIDPLNLGFECNRDISTVATKWGLEFATTSRMTEALWGFPLALCCFFCSCLFRRLLRSLHMRRTQIQSKRRTLLGGGEGQCRAVAAAVASEVSGKIGRSVHDNLGGTGRRDLGRGNRDL